MTTAVLPDIDIEALYEESIPCEVTPYISMTQCPNPAQWVGILPCGCRRHKCDDCLQRWLACATVYPDPHDGSYSLRCATCKASLRSPSPDKWFRRMR